MVERCLTSHSTGAGSARLSFAGLECLLQCLPPGQLLCECQAPFENKRVFVFVFGFVFCFRPFVLEPAAEAVVTVGNSERFWRRVFPSFHRLVFTPGSVA